MILERIRETVSRYVDILHQVLKVNIEIIDEAYQVISSTENAAAPHRYKAYVYADVLRTGEKKVIKDPGHEAICLACPSRETCEDTFELHAPIKLEKKVIGVICFSCSNDEQREYILTNYSTIIEFIDQISDLISLKAKESIEEERTRAFLNLLSSVIDRVDQCIVMLDQQDRMTKANRAARTLFGLKDEDLSSAPVSADLRDGLNQGEYVLTLQGRERTLIGELHALSDLERILIFTDQQALNARLLERTNTRENLSLQDILGDSSGIRALKEKVLKIGKSSSTVLITGPSGTGKELFARAIHMQSDNGNAPFVAINCAAIPDTLLESELFGYVKGAFTNADPKGKIGKIELASGGTLFLDEIGDMPLYIQAKLLRAIEQKEVVRLGANVPVRVDVRFIAATNKELEKMIAQKQFREDLYYRLKVIPFEIPALKERKGDICVLTQYFIQKYASLLNKNVAGVAEGIWPILFDYDWPGNVRELENTVEYMINMVEDGDLLSEGLLPEAVASAKPQSRRAVLPIAELEKEQIRQGLLLYGAETQGKQIMAQELGIGIATLYRKIKKYGLQ